MGKGFSAHLPSLEEHASRIDDRAGQVSEVGKGASGAGLHGSALGTIGESQVAGHQNMVSRITSSAGNAADKLRGQSSLVRGTKRSIEDTDNDHAERLKRIKPDANAPTASARSQSASGTGAPGKSPRPMYRNDYQFTDAAGNAHTAKNWMVTDSSGHLVGVSSIKPGVQRDAHGNPILDANGNPVRDDGTKDWANALNGNTKLEDYDQGHGGRLAGVQPVGGMSQTMVADAHADKHGFESTVDGRTQFLNGTQYADMVHQSPEFQQLEQAGRTHNIVLSSCEAGQRGASAAPDFGRRMADLTGHPVTVFSGTGTVLTGVNPDGSASLGTTGRWIAHHAEPGMPSQASGTTEWR